MRSTKHSFQDPLFVERQNDLGFKTPLKPLVIPSCLEYDFVLSAGMGAQMCARFCICHAENHTLRVEITWILRVHSQVAECFLCLAHLLQKPVQLLPVLMCVQ